MPKRKAEEAGLPAVIAQEPASTDGTGPFVVYFPSRFDPKGDVACECQTYAHSERRNQFVVVGKTDHKVDFVGSTANAEYSTAPPCRFALALFDRAAGSLQVMPCEGGKVLRLEPRVHGMQYGARGVRTEIETGGMREANTRLVEEFGSQRRKRQLKAREAGKVDAGQVVAGQAVLGMLASAGEAAPVSKEELIKSSLAQRNIPPHHPDARTAGDAYRMDEIVPPGVRDALEITKLFPAENKPDYRAQLKSQGMFGASYVFTRLPLLSTTDKALREERCRALCMLGHLLKLHGEKRNNVLKCGAAGGLEELAIKVKASPSVLEGLLDLFYYEDKGQGEMRTWILTKEKKSLMLNWALILALRAEQNSVLEADCFQDLCTELKMKPAEVLQRYREVGCVDVPASFTAADGSKARGHRITLMPPSAEGEKTLDDYFPALKMGGKRR